MIILAIQMENIKESGMCQILDVNHADIFWDCTCTKNFWKQFSYGMMEPAVIIHAVTLGLNGIFFGCGDMTLCHFNFTAKFNSSIYYRCDLLFDAGCVVVCLDDDALAVNCRLQEND